MYWPIAFNDGADNIGTITHPAPCVNPIYKVFWTHSVVGNGINELLLKLALREVIV